MLYPLLLGALVCLHLLAATAWVGGMAAMHFAVRPAAQQVLETPALRLRFMAAVLDRFFRWVASAIVLLWATGIAMLALVGNAALHWSLLAMIGIGAFMTVVFVFIRRRPFARLCSAVALSQWPTAADALASIRRLVTLNLTLGVCVYAATLIGRVIA